MADSNLQGCPDRNDIQVDLAKAAYEICAAQEALNAAHTGPSPIANTKALNDQLAGAKEKHAEISGRLVDHTSDCPACAELRKAA